jgi:hypothetical protein
VVRFALVAVEEFTQLALRLAVFGLRITVSFDSLIPSAKPP